MQQQQQHYQHHQQQQQQLTLITPTLIGLEEKVWLAKICHVNLISQLEMGLEGVSWSRRGLDGN